MFDDIECPASAAVLAAVLGTTPLSSAQGNFRRLNEQVHHARGALAAWDAYMARFRQRVACDLQSVERELRDA